MPDARPPEVAAAPQDDWGQALAALPLEAPPPDSWNRIAARLPRRRSPTRYWIPAAIAASLAVLLVARWKLHDSTQPPAQVADVARNADGIAQVVKPDVPVPQPVESVPVDRMPVDSAPVDSTLVDSAPTHRATGVADTATASTQPATTGSPSQPPRTRAPSPSPAPAPAAGRQAQPAATQLADAASQQKGSDVAASVEATPGAALATTTPPPSAPTQEDLYAESARLEALLSQLSDESVSSGTAMALSTELHQRVAGIDAALSQPDLQAGARLALWRERVATLQRLTGVESTQRWMAANGYRADGQVAQVY